MTLELSAPANMILRSSCHEWCSVFFDCRETGEIDDNSNWLDWKAVAAHNSGDVVQAIFPFLKRDWITEHAHLRLNPEV